MNIYGPCTGEMRELFVDWLFELNIPNDEDWLILGDFNFIRSPENRNKPGEVLWTCLPLMISLENNV